ncbi:MAG: ATP-binding cassette domain-containing protein [Spirochaetaceae bacterium]|jgi:simple sugar transport system ATP-binding protein|nr:ATP-binding cassette domain-containing protein [Spirochaetaceae bacterium]
MVELRRIQKYFSANGVKALDGADFNLKEGEIHALLGENGAGKSTLMQIMAGFIRPSTENRIRDLLPDKPGSGGRAGTITVDGREQRFSSPAQAMAAGIGMVRQHPHQIPGFPVWANCDIGSTRHPVPWLDRKAHRRRIIAMEKRLGFGLPMDSPTEALTVSQSQKAAILALLLRDVRYLIFDEPTAVLSPVETAVLFEIFRRLKDQGKGIVFISHKLEETLKLADRVTVLRDGKTQVCLGADTLSGKTLWEFMFGPESISHSSPPPDVHPNTMAAVQSDIPSDVKSGIQSDYKSDFSPGPPTAAAGPLPRGEFPALFLRRFSVAVPGRPLIRGVDLTLRRGKIMGITGVRDSGLETLELAVTGFLPSSGEFFLNGLDLSRGNPRSFRGAGGAYLGTRNEGANLPIRDLLIVHAHRRFQRRGFLELKKLDAWVRSVMTTAKVPLRERAPAAAFSGGQLQRLLLTREIAETCSLLVLSEPGRGLDRRYQKRLSALLREKTASGTAVLIFSTDVEELLTLADSIAVLRDGTITGAMDISAQDDSIHEKIRSAMVGQV